MSSLLQTHTYTVVTKALHTFKMKQPYMILSNKVSCYDIAAAVSCKLEMLSLLSHFFVLQLTAFLHHRQYPKVLLSVAYILVTSKRKAKGQSLSLYLSYNIQSPSKGPCGEPATGDPWPMQHFIICNFK